MRFAGVAVLATVGMLVAGCSSSGVIGARGAPTDTASASPTSDPVPTETPATAPSTTFSDPLSTEILTPPPPAPTTTQKPRYTGTTKDTCPYLTANQMAVLVGEDIYSVGRIDQKPSSKGCSYDYYVTNNGIIQPCLVSMLFAPGVGSSGFAYVVAQEPGSKSVSGIGSKATWGDETLVVLTRDGGVAVVQAVSGTGGDLQLAEKVFKAASSKM